MMLHSENHPLIRQCWPKALLATAGLMLLVGCTTTPPPVLKQAIPVSSDPIGATIYADGVAMGTTPTRIALARNSDHLLTLVKEGYRQQDVPIRRQYQSDKVLLSAVQSGINSAKFFKDSNMGLQSGMNSISSQERTGAAYTLTPTTVSISLQPRDGKAAPATSGATMTAATAESAPRQSVMDASPAALLGVAALAGASQMKPAKKEWTSSSSSSYVTSSGSQVTKTSSTSVGVGINPVGVASLVNSLFLAGSK